MKNLSFKLLFLSLLSTTLLTAETPSDSLLNLKADDLYKRFLEISKQFESINFDSQLGQMPEGQFHLKIEVDALDSLLKNLPIPKKIEISGESVRFDDAPVELPIKTKPMHKIERKEIVKFGEDALIGRNEWVNGDVVVFGGDATIYGSVSGGVIVVNGDVRLASTSNIEKDIVCLWGNTDIDAGAHVKGETVVFNFGRWASDKYDGGLLSIVQLAFKLLMMVILFVAAVIIESAFPQAIDVIQRNIKQNYAKNLLIGFATLFLLPIIFIVLIATIIGIPIAILLYPLAILAGYLFGMVAFYLILGEWIQTRFKITRQSKFIRIGLGLLALELPLFFFRVITVFLPSLSHLMHFIILILFITIWTPGFGAVLATRFGKKTPDSISSPT